MGSKMHQKAILLALIATVCVGIIDAADVQCSPKHASLQGAGPIRPADSPKSRKLLTLGGGFSVNVPLPSVQVTAGTDPGVPSVRRGGNSGPDSWQWWGGNNGPSWQQPGFGTPGWNRPPPSWNRPPPSWQRPPPSWNRNPGWTR